MELPESDGLDIARLASVFKKTTNSYKFYWFLAILDSLKENGQGIILKNDIALRMVANVWYPLDYFKLSFGKEDGFKKIAQYVSERITIDHSINSPDLFKQLTSKLSKQALAQVYKDVDERVKYVPYRFVRPFLNEQIIVDSDYQVKSQVIEVSNEMFSSHPERVMYRFIDDSIEINELWVSYLQRHQGILRGFIYWHLLIFLQKNNQTVVGLPDKLFKRSDRNFKLAKPFWMAYLSANPGLTCIYSGEIITQQNISLDHFLPWSYVVHDQTWNIVPTPKSVNSAKSNSLPSEQLYFESYAKLQFDAFHFHAKKGNVELLADYHVVFAQDIESIQRQSFEEFKEQLSRQILPQLQSARNLGFFYPFVYRNS